MKLRYESLHDERSHKRKSHKVEFYVLKQKEFNEYRKEQEDAGQVVSIVRNTSLKPYKKKKDSQEDEYLTIGTKKFALKQESSKKASGYIHVGDNRFVRIEKKFWPVIVLLLAAILIGVLIWYLSRPGEHKVGPIDIEAFNPIRNDVVTEDATQEYTTFPGYSTITAKKGASLIQLKNPEGNTVNFIYTITEETSDSIEENFDNVMDAQSYVTEHSIAYTNYYDKKSKKYLVKDPDGNTSDEITEYKIEKSADDKYVVHKKVSNIIYFTKGIAPNNAKDWDIAEYLTKGTHNLTFRIATYDVDSNAQCYGNNMDVEVIVK